MTTPDKDGQRAARLEGVSLRRGNRDVLRDIGLELRAGEIVGLTGKSGSGKTTLLCALVGIKAPDRGQVAIKGRAILLPQDCQGALNPALTIRRQMQLLPGNAIDTNVLRRCGIRRPDEILDRRPGQLSGGECQRVALALVFSRRPKVLALDEPTSALDEELRAVVVDVLSWYVRAHGAAALVVSHDVNILNRSCDRVLHLDSGVIRSEAPQLIGASEKIRMANPVRSGSPRLVLKGLRKSVQGIHEKVTELFNGIDLKVFGGTAVGIAGPSGCGKSTLGRIIVGMVQADAGVMRLHGREIDLTRLHSIIGGVGTSIQYVAQNIPATFHPNKEVGAALEEVARFANGGSDRGERWREQLGPLGLDAGCLNRRPELISGGELQRLALVRAMIVCPSVLILDEPTSALDVHTRGLFLDWVMERLQSGIAMLLISHDQALLAQCSTKIIHLPLTAAD